MQCHLTFEVSSTCPISISSVLQTFVSDRLSQGSGRAAVRPFYIFVFFQILKLRHDRTLTAGPADRPTFDAKALQRCALLVASAMYG